MQPEGPNKSEELLQRYAKQRREQDANFSLHPATRRLLQGEVTRQYGAGKREEKSSLSWFSLWRTRFAMAAATAVIAATGTWIFLTDRNSPTMQLADAKPSPKEEMFGRSLEPGRSEAEKEVLATAPSVERKLSERTVALRSARDADLDLATRAPAAPSMPAQKSAVLQRERSYFANSGIASTAIVANSALSLAPAANSGGKAGDGVPAAATRFGLAIDDLSENAKSVAPQSAGSLAANGTIAPGKTIPNSASLADNAALSYNVPAPTLATKDAEAKLPHVSQLSESDQRSQAFGENRTSPSGPAALQAPSTVAGSRQLAASDKAKRAEILDRSDQNVAAASVAGDETKTTFFRLNESISANQVALGKAVREEAKKVSEPTSPSVLARFTIEQRDRAVRVTDADGSVYVGELDAPVATQFEAETIGEKAEMLREKTVGLPEANVSRAREASFRASGSNVTLHQFVVVNGTFTQAGSITTANQPATAPSVAARRGFASGGSFSKASGANTNAPVAIEGTVRVGATNLQWFKAVRESR